MCFWCNPVCYFCLYHSYFLDSSLTFIIFFYQWEKSENRIALIGLGFTAVAGLWVTVNLVSVIIHFLVSLTMEKTTLFASDRDVQSRFDQMYLVQCSKNLRFYKSIQKIDSITQWFPCEHQLTNPWCPWNFYILKEAWRLSLAMQTLQVH